MTAEKVRRVENRGWEEMEMVGDMARLWMGSDSEEYEGQSASSMEMMDENCREEDEVMIV